MRFFIFKKNLTASLLEKQIPWIFNCG